MTKIIVLPVFMLAGFGEGTPQQDSMRAKCAAGEIWTHGRILLFSNFTLVSNALNYGTDVELPSISIKSLDSWRVQAPTYSPSKYNGYISSLGIVLLLISP